MLPNTPIYDIFFLTLLKQTQTNNGKNDQRIWWQREVRFEGCYDETREKGRQEGREDGEERCVPEDEEEVKFFYESPGSQDLGLFLTLYFVLSVQSVQKVYKLCTNIPALSFCTIF